MNIFEGARRIAKAIAVLGILMAVVVTFSTEPYVHVYYQISKNGLSLIDRCSDSRTTYTRIKAEELDVFATICGMDNGPSEIGILNEEMEPLRKSIAEQKRAYYLKALGITISTLLAYWIAIAVFGWIVRGFLGIPRGQDYRIIPAQPQ